MAKVSDPLPTGYTVRPPTPADAAALHQAIAAHHSRAIGYPDSSLARVTEELTDPAHRPETDGWMVLGRDGEVVSYARVLQRSGQQLLTLAVHVPGTPVSGWLYRTAVERARSLGREQGYAEITLQAGVHRDDQLSREELRTHGFALETTYHRMRIDHSTPAEPPAPPPGCGLTRGPVDEAARRAAYDVMVAAFDGQAGSRSRRHAPARRHR